MATLLKVLINLADIKSAGGVALRVGIQGVFPPARIIHRILRAFAKSTRPVQRVPWAEKELVHVRYKGRCVGFSCRIAPLWGSCADAGCSRGWGDPADYSVNGFVRRNHSRSAASAISRS
jgi:hypothetical protein